MTGVRRGRPGARLDREAQRRLRSATMAKKNECVGDHDGHICVLASKDMFDVIKAITRNPQHICFNCGRVADQSKNLCNPMPLKD